MLKLLVSKMQEQQPHAAPYIDAYSLTVSGSDYVLQLRNSTSLFQQLFDLGSQTITGQDALSSIKT